MVKKQKSKTEKQEIIKVPEQKSKEELIEIMNRHLDSQQEIAETLRDKALLYMGDDCTDTRENKKNRNQFIYAYNQQVEAVSKTVVSLIRIQGSSLKNDRELEEEQQQIKEQEQSKKEDNNDKQEVTIETKAEEKPKVIGLVD